MQAEHATEARVLNHINIYLNSNSESRPWRRIIDTDRQDCEPHTLVCVDNQIR